MTKILYVANKLMTLRGRIQVTDADETLAYEAVGEWSFNPTWRVFAGGQSDRPPVATLRRRVFAWTPTWDIHHGDEAFQIKRKIFSWTRQHHVVGGHHDGAVIQGDVWDLKFTIAQGGWPLAQAAGKLFSLRDRHGVEIADAGDERFVLLAMLVVQLDRLQARRNRAMHGDDD